MSETVLATNPKKKEIIDKMVKRGESWTSKDAFIESEEAAFFLAFNWKEISNAGHSAYGAYVYSQLLPHLAPLSDAGSMFGVTLVFDGDIVPQSEQAFLSATGEQGQELIKQCDLDELYILAFYRTGAGTLFQNVLDRSLKQSSPIGFVDLIPCVAGGEDREKFTKLALSKLYLPPALLQSFGRCTLLNFSFLAPKELIEMGFVSVSKSEGVS